MKFLLFFTLFLMLLLIGSIFANKYFTEYADPFKLNFYIGKKGSGKSTLIAKLALRALKKGRYVYCNYPLNIPGTRTFSMEDFGTFKFPPNSEVFVDEGTIHFHNREYKNFKAEARNYFIFQRKYKNVLHMFSQAWNVDLVIRTLCDNIYLVEKHMYVFSIARKVARKLVVVEPEGDAEGRIADGLELEPLWLQFIGFRVSYFTYIPKYTKYFNSFDAPEIDDIPYQEYCPPEVIE